MTDAPRPAAGRHRSARADRVPLLARVSPALGRPGTIALKSLAVTTTAAGVAAALLVPSGSSVSSLSSMVSSAAPSGWALVSERSADASPAAVVAPAAVGPVNPATFGLLGFSAAPRPKPAPAVSRAAAAPRAEQVASRSVSYARSGLAVENGLTRNAIAVLNAVREEFPELTQFGGVRPGDPGDHGSGHALDIMTSTSEGDAVARYLQGRAGELGIRYLIWKQRRWAPGGTWVPMEDRGSITANHYDHVHVSVR